MRPSNNRWHTTRYAQAHLRYNARMTKKRLRFAFIFGTPLIITALALYLWLFRGLPPITDLEAGLALPSTQILDRHGRLLYEITPPGAVGRNVVLPLDDIPADCANAVVATEDANYYRHPGVDAVGVIRAVWLNVRGGEIVAGGSTITQQVARNLLLDPQQRAERTVRRKLREMILALRLERRYSKDEVLALWLNQTDFGNLAYGVDAAARAYFGKPVGDLSLAECALLAGLPQNPAIHNPLTRPEAARERQSIVLGLMVDAGYIGQAQAAAAARDDLQYAAVLYPIEAPHAVMTVWSQLAEAYPDALYTQGLVVTTTVDLDWQRAAERIAGAQLAALNDNRARTPANAQNAALVAMDPHTGEVLTMLGNPNYFDERSSGAVNGALTPRQPGSALKPFTYAIAMSDPTEPWTAATMILDVHTPFITRKLESYTPSNYGFTEHGPVLVREALASSYNIPAVVALEAIGVARLIEFLAEAGVVMTNPELDLALTLGGGEVRLLDLTAAYGVFATGGERVQPVLIREVRTADGDVLFAHSPPRERPRLLSEGVAFIISDMLSDPGARLPGFGPNSLLQIGRPAAAKTGTTTDWRDNWVVGYTPNLVVGVWVGNADYTPMIDVTGIDGAGPIWHQFMREVLRGQPEVAFELPPGLVRREVCALSGMLPTPHCPNTRTEWFIEGTEPTEPDTFYQPFTIDTRTGHLADDTTPDEFRTEEVFIVLPQAARAWAARNGFRTPPLDVVEAGAGLRILSPDPFTVYELSRVLPPEAQRIRIGAAVAEGTARVTFTLNGEVVATVEDAPFETWWTLEAGAWEVVAVAETTVGETEASAPLQFSVVTDAPQPAVREVGP